MYFSHPRLSLTAFGAWMMFCIAFTFLAAVFSVLVPLLQELYKIVRQLSSGQVGHGEVSRPSTSVSHVWGALSPAGLMEKPGLAQ